MPNHVKTKNQSYEIKLRKDYPHIAYIDERLLDIYMAASETYITQKFTPYTHDVQDTIATNTWQKLRIENKIRNLLFRNTKKETGIGETHTFQNRVINFPTQFQHRTNESFELRPKIWNAANYVNNSN